ncbi:MAG: hypothetical protein ACFFB2_16105 [Promethearchaeota archaeon]
MIKIAIVICKKELKIRFGSRRVLIPMVFSLGLPMLVFIPSLLDAFSESEPENDFFRFLLFLILPVLVTTLVGINTFINEIRWKTIKPLLVTPISEKEIFLGKSMACIVAGLITQVLLSGIILFTVNLVQLSTILLLFIIGPLSVIFTTFIFIIGTSRFPTVAEGGGAVLMPIGGLLIILMIFFLFVSYLQFTKILGYALLALILLILVFMTYFLAKKWFNREILVLAL